METAWVLVEWVDENNVFPSYGIVNIDTFYYQESDLQPGKQIFISLKNSDPRRAKIIRICDNKRQLKEHKDFLERQDQQVKNVLQLCMRTIKEMKSEQYPNPTVHSHTNNNSVNGSHIGLPHVITANSESSLSDSDAEVTQVAPLNKMTKVSQILHQNVRYDPSFKRGTQSPAMNMRRQSVMSSTPLPKKYNPENIKLYIDQGTQTEAEWLQPPISKIEEIELVLKHLYGRFQSLVLRVNSATMANENMVMTEPEQNDEVSYVERNDSWPVSNNITDNPVQNCQSEDRNVPVDISAEQMVVPENQSESIQNTNPVKLEHIHKNPEDSTRVRRMSAQTTYSNEMVPIGNGRAIVPVRLLNDINWSSYTNATRQLLQAIFPRKVLATHSLTGKPSPAHLNKPPKKLLDPGLVEDIIITVSSRCGVAKNLVRNSITVKCTDEAKLYRNRQQHQLSRSLQKNKQNDENAPPAAHSSDD